MLGNLVMYFMSACLLLLCLGFKVVSDLLVWLSLVLQFGLCLIAFLFTCLYLVCL